MKKKIIILTGVVASLLIISGLFVFAANKNQTQSINFENKAYKLESKTFKFNNKVYELKELTPNSHGGYANNYYTDNETFDTYHTAIMIDKFLNTDFEKMKDGIYNTVSNRIKSADKNNLICLFFEPINKNSFLVRECIFESVKDSNVIKCSYTNVQKGIDGNSVVIFDYVQRYFIKDGIVTNSNYKQVIESDYAKIKPYITTVKAPDIVSKEKFSKQRSLEDIIKDQVK